MKKNNLETAEEVSILNDIVFDDDISTEEHVEEVKVKEKKKIKHAFIKHNASENYVDKTKVAELGVDLYPGGFSREMGLAAIERGRKNYYITGLDKSLYKENWELEFLEESLATLVKNFGQEVLDPLNMEFWKTRTLTVKEEETLLDLENPDDLLTYWNIKGGGYPYIAKSGDELNLLKCRFYLDEPNTSYEHIGDSDKLKDRAIAMLSDIDNGANGFSTLFFLHKNLITTNEGVTKNTPKSLIYKSLRNYINGDYTTTKKKVAPKKFIEEVDTYRTNSKRSKTVAIVNDSIYFGFLVPNRDNQYTSTVTSYNFKTTDKAKVIELLMSPNNSDELLALLKEVELKWNKY